jgi:hypothetical protein
MGMVIRRRQRAGWLADCMRGIPDLGDFARQVLDARGWSPEAITASMLRHGLGQDSEWGALVATGGSILATRLQELIEGDPHASRRLGQLQEHGSLSLDDYYTVAFEMHERDDAWCATLHRLSSEWLKQAQPALITNRTDRATYGRVTPAFT